MKLYWKKYIKIVVRFKQIPSCFNKRLTISKFPFLIAELKAVI